jgi:hypothetical protein
VAYLAPVPWNSEYDRFRRITKKGQKQSNLEWSLSSGWRSRQDDEWDKQPKKPKTKRIKIRDRMVEVPDADYEDFLGHLVSPPSDPDSEIGRYIDEANFSQSFTMDKGHIAKIEYAPTRQLLDVTFQANEQGQGGHSEVIFFVVPKEVFYELKYLGESGRTQLGADGKTWRHVIGIRFWDIVRVRGTVNVTRYRFEYLEGYSPQGSKFGRSVEQSLAEDVAETKSTKETVEAENTTIVDSMARNFLTGTKLDEYRRLKTYKQKMEYLHRMGIID